MGNSLEIIYICFNQEKKETAKDGGRIQKFCISYFPVFGMNVRTKFCLSSLKNKEKQKKKIKQLLQN